MLLESLNIPLTKLTTSSKIHFSELGFDSKVRTVKVWQRRLNLTCMTSSIHGFSLENSIHLCNCQQLQSENIFFVFPFLLPCTWNWWGEKNIQRQPPVPSSANYWYISIRCSCKQLKFTVPKQRVPIQQTQKGASRYLGNRNNDKAYNQKTWAFG